MITIVAVLLAIGGALAVVWVSSVGAAIVADRRDRQLAAEAA